MPPPPGSPARPAPLSPKKEEASGSPVTSLPRHSRGINFARVSTTLHHSTLPNTPDSSPMGASCRARKGSVGGDAQPIWGMPRAERSTLSSSVGSVDMLGSDSGSSDSEMELRSSAGIEDEDVFTPQPCRNSVVPQTPTSHLSAMWNASPKQATLIRTIRRARLTGRRRRKGSSSTSNSGYSSLTFPRAASPIQHLAPPPLHVEAGTPHVQRSARNSLALGRLRLSSSNDSGDEGASVTPTVVRRPVTRAGSLLPKTKGFARIRAALMEEASPVDSETRRERETIRQVRERDDGVELYPDAALITTEISMTERARSLSEASTNNSMQVDETNTGSLMKSMKRRREDDFDPIPIKRRAVSPSVSTQSSPVPGSTRERKLGLQGMLDTNDGFVKMSIE
ncbi:hypothetical protein K470DRAFT_264364 [Piedraia hortae CBS 480.64]|uniref:Uncharacterized protein n=1 Tax=Piedraia hortae CBS 480.64 TaxID=1314780 RepID=A0A6A7C0M2_9PEZI|nr:hypothetical protein K470DRAFT_264364 [Piedraia hortae CBS 480.64]